jgi:hypothetical protein
MYPPLAPILSILSHPLQGHQELLANRWLKLHLAPASCGVKASMMVESITQSRTSRTPRQIRMATNRQKVTQYTQMPRLSRRRRNWLELITTPGAYPQAATQSVHRFMRRTIASGESCHTLMTKIVTKILSCWYVAVHPADPAASECHNPSESNTMKRVSGSNRNSWTIWGEKVKGPWLTKAVMACCWHFAGGYANLSNKFRFPLSVQSKNSFSSYIVVKASR